jgi:uncharacterized lipoprotein
MSAGIPHVMQAMKVWRRAALALQAAGICIEDARTTRGGHVAVTVAQDGRRATIRVSSSPCDEESACTMAVQMAKRRLRDAAADPTNRKVKQ